MRHFNNYPAGSAEQRQAEALHWQVALEVMCGLPSAGFRLDDNRGLRVVSGIIPTDAMQEIDGLRVVVRWPEVLGRIPLQRTLPPIRTKLRPDRFLVGLFDGPDVPVADAQPFAAFGVEAQRVVVYDGDEAPGLADGPTIIQLSEQLTKAVQAPETLPPEVVPALALRLSHFVGEIDRL